MKRAYFVVDKTWMVYDLTALSRGNGKEFTMGRGEVNDLNLAEDSLSEWERTQALEIKALNSEDQDTLSTVSERHAKIRFIKDFFGITDTGSLNGTFVNGIDIRGIPDYRLTPDAEVKVGKHILHYEEA